MRQTCVVGQWGSSSDKIEGVSKIKYHAKDERGSLVQQEILLVVNQLGLCRAVRAREAGSGRAAGTSERRSTRARHPLRHSRLIRLAALRVRAMMLLVRFDALKAGITCDGASHTVHDAKTRTTEKCH